MTREHYPDKPSSREIPLPLLFSTNDPNSITDEQIDAYNAAQADAKARLSQEDATLGSLEAGTQPTDEERHATVLDLLADGDPARSLSAIELVLGRRVDAQEVMHDAVLSQVVLAPGAPELKYEALVGVKAEIDKLEQMGGVGQ